MMKLFILRRFSVIGCEAHGPFGRDMQPDSCETCAKVAVLRRARHTMMCERLNRAAVQA